jgi:hypothetical protein
MVIKEEHKMNPIDRVLSEAGLPNPLDVLPTPKKVADKLEIPTPKEIIEGVWEKIEETVGRRRLL